MSSVDNRVVELKFDNKQFEAGTAQSMSTLDKLKKSLDFSSSKKSMDDLAASTKNFDVGHLGTTIEGVSGKFLALSTIGITALANITTQAIETGKTIYKSLTVDPIKSGFGEYELKMNAIQTIMAGSGEKLKTVNKYLEQLNTYSDKTIYSFSDMTQNIGKFTNAGVSLKDSVAAIQGIANVAAVSGANSEEASRAMYNFSQALSKGSVALIDWKSIELANMGTVEFKQQLIDAAVAQGKLTKKGNEYVTQKGTMLSATKGFNETLEQEWLTTDVLTKTLGDYSNAQTAIGKKATAAAQNVKTLTQLYDTLKESAGSGWAKTFEILFGNLDEATKLWTGLNGVVGGWIQTSADNRNEMLQSFKDMGGVKMAIDAIKAAFKALMSWIKPVKDAWASVFSGGNTAYTLLQIVTNLKMFFQAMTLGPVAMANLKTTFAGLFAILHIGAQILGGVFHFFQNLFRLFSAYGTGAGSGLLGVTAGIGNMLINFDEMLAKSGVITKFFDNLLTKLKPVVEFLAKVAGVISDAFAQAPAIFKRMGDGASGVNEELSPLEQTLTTLAEVWYGFVEAVRDTWKFLTNVASTIADTFKSTGEGTGGFFSGIVENLQKLDWPTIFKAALAGGFLASMGIFFKALYGAVDLIIFKPREFLGSIVEVIQSVSDVMDQFRDTLKAYQKTLRAKALLTIAAAILVLAIALTIISRIPYQQLGKATVAIGALFYMLQKTMDGISEIGNGESFKKIPAIAFAMLLLGGAMLLLALALKIMASIPFWQLAKGIFAFGVTITILVGVMTLLSRLQGKMIQAATAILILGVAMLVLVGALWVYSKLPLEVIFRGGAAMAIVLAAIAAAMQLMPKEGKLLASAAAILILSVAMALIVHSLQILAALDPEKFKQAMLGFAASLVMLVGSLLLMTDPLILVGAEAMIIAAAALNILAHTIELLGNMSFKQLALGIGAIAVAMAVIAGVSIALAPAIPLVAAFGSALMTFGAGLALVGLGALAFAMAFSIAVGLAALGAPVLRDAINQFIEIIPDLARGFYIALTEFAIAFTKAIPVLVKAAVTFFTEMLSAMDEMTPRIMHTLGIFLDAFILYITNYIPKLVDAGMKMVNGILDGISKNMPDLIEKGTDVIVAFLEGIGEAGVRIATAAGEALITFLNGLTDWINNNSDRLNQAGIDLIDAIISGMVSGVGQLGGRAIDAISGLATNVIDAAKGVFDSSSPSKVFQKIGQDVVAGLVKGIVGDRQHVADVLKALREEVHKAQVDAYNDIKDHKEKIKKLEDEKKLSKAEQKELAKLKAELKNIEAEKKRLDEAYKSLSEQHKKQRAELISLGSDYDKTSKALDKATQKLKDAIKKRDDYRKSIKEQYSKLPDIAEDTSLDTYFDQIRKSTEANKKFKASLDKLRTLGLDDTSYKKFLEQGTEAQPFLDQLLAGGKNVITELNKIDQGLVSSASSLGKTASEELYQAGVDSAQGLVDGLEKNLDKITAKMKKIGKAIADEIKKELGIKSPSKVFKDIGKFTVEGLAKGMDENAKVIDISAKKIGKTAIDGLRDSMSDLSSIIGSEVNLEPVIAPVLDLDKFRKDASAVNKLLTPNGIIANASTAAAVDISTKQQAQKLLAEQQAAGGGNVVEFNQYNTSPKALSTAEVYRQTKNQLSVVKEALGR